MPSASIIITTYNRPDLLPRAIASARASGKDVEVIVVDDASSDETASICQSTRGINYVRLDRNQGVAGARNVGLVASRGEYVSFLDDDDVRLPNSLDEQIEALRAEDPLAWPSFATEEDVVGFPPTVISVSECDPMRDEGIAFYRLLLRAGVTARGRQVLGTPHSTEIFPMCGLDITLSTANDIAHFAKSELPR